MTYAEWKSVQDARYGDGAVDKARKMSYNESADHKQFEAYRARLGDDAPKTFADFKRLKYDDETAYSELKGYFRYKGTAPEGMSFEEWKQTLASGEGASGLTNGGSGGILKLASKFVNPNEGLYTNANRIKPLDGYGDIVIHGNPTALVINGLDGEEWTYNAEQAAEMIKNSKEFHGQPIRLIACRAGALEDGIAQQIADELGVNVLAPTEDVNVDISGEMFLCNNDVIAIEWSRASKEERKRFRETGKWVLFKPRRK